MKTKRIVSVMCAAALAAGVISAPVSAKTSNSSKIEVKDVKLNVGTTNIITIKSANCADYTLKYDKKLLKYHAAYIHGNVGEYTFTAKKKGTTTVKVLAKHKVCAKFKVTVGDFKASLKKSYKKQTLKYNKHVKSYNFYDGGMVDLVEAVKLYHPDAKYTVKIKNKKIATSRMIKKSGNLPAHAQIYSVKPGKTTADVYEQRNGKKTKLGTIKLTVKTVKDSDAVDINYMNDNDGIFYEFFVRPGDNIDLKSILTERYINGALTSKKFEESEFEIKVEAGPADTLSVDKDGVITVLKTDSADSTNWVEYTIKFSDGSKIEGQGSFNIEEAEQ